MIPQNYFERRIFLFSIVNWMIENNATLRKAEKEFHVSKSTIHKFCRSELPGFNKSFAIKVGKLLDKNLSEAPHRGGKALREKLLNEKNTVKGDKS